VARSEAAVGVEINIVHRAAAVGRTVLLLQEALPEVQLLVITREVREVVVVVVVVGVERGVVEWGAVAATSRVVVLVVVADIVHMALLRLAIPDVPMVVVVVVEGAAAAVNLAVVAAWKALVLNIREVMLVEGVVGRVVAVEHSHRIVFLLILPIRVMPVEGAVVNGGVEQMVVALILLAIREVSVDNNGIREGAYWGGIIG